MRVPLEWLKEYIDIKVSPQTLADKLTLAGVEIEGLSHKTFDRVVIGEIINIKKHPKADKLQVTEVDIGSKILQIVCGAKNIEIGQKVPVALVGASLGEKEIQRVNIRGVDSEGMLCSEADLSLSDDHTGIMILDPRAKIGANLVTALDIGGIVLDAELTPNRGDLLSILGMARELKAIFGQKLSQPKMNFKEISKETLDYINVKISDFDLCPRYLAKVVEVPEIGESPSWMQDRLSACGIRPINAVVDITNYVMLELGQPLHAFDAYKIEGGKIIVRRARDKEKIRTLDGIDRELNKENLVIADSSKPIALAGVMGGANSEVDLKSRLIVLEAAKFDKTNIRRTGNSLALRTEAVLRFEKEVPFDLPEIALKRACHLLQKICGAKIYKGQADIYKNRPKEKVITLEMSKVEKLLGVNIPQAKVLGILKSLGFTFNKLNKEVYSFIVPWWRVDVSIWQDLIEEIARIYGYDKIPATLPKGELPSFSRNFAIKWVDVIKNTLVGLGFFEICTYSFVGKDLWQKVGLNVNDCIKIKNPLSTEQEYLRTSLIPSLLETVARNLKNYEQFKLFEIASVYFPQGRSFSEEKRIVGSWVGAKEDLFYGIKNIVKILLQSLGILFQSRLPVEVEPLYPKSAPEGIIFEPRRSAQLKINNQLIGFFGEVKSEILLKFDIPKPVGLFTLSLPLLFKYATGDRSYRPISKFPPSHFDLAVVVDQKIPEGKIRQLIARTIGFLLYKIELFDIYTGEQVPSGKKSLAYHLTLQAPDRTLTETEVMAIRNKVIQKLKIKLKAFIRGEDG